MCPEDYYYHPKGLANNATLFYCEHHFAGIIKKFKFTLENDSRTDSYFTIILFTFKNRFYFNPAKLRAESEKAKSDRLNDHNKEYLIDKNSNQRD